MPLIGALHRAALWAKRRLQPVLRRRRAAVATRAVDPYPGYATRDHLILRGRVLATPPRQRSPGQRRLANLRNMAALFLTDELADVEIRHGDVTARSDDEGYFQLHLPRKGMRTTGWQQADLTVAGMADPVACAALVPDRDARVMILSDIDDTVLQTGAYSLLRNLWTTFTGSTATRHVFADAIALMRALSAGGRNPVYYVSSSPWNLHAFLEDVLWPAGLVRGPMFLRDLGLSETRFITDGHGSHKGRSIDLLMAANPGLPAILIGDTGQHDARIYRDAVRRHPGRVRAVLLRQARRGRADSAAVDDLRRSGVPVQVAPRLDPGWDILRDAARNNATGRAVGEAHTEKEHTMPAVENSKILIMATHGFEQSELTGPKQQLADAGATVHVATLDGEPITGWDTADWGISVDADLKISDVNVDDYIALVLPGGQINPDILRTDETAVQVVRDFVAGNKIVAAICHAPWMLIEAGVVEGREMTAYPSIRTDLRNAGADVVDKEVAISNGIITSRNPGDIDAFVAKILEEVKEGEHQRDVAAQ